MSEAWDWYLKQKENAQGRWKETISDVNKTGTPQHILHLKLCGDALTEKSEGKPLFTELHVNQLMHLAYLAGVNNSKCADIDRCKDIKNDLRESFKEWLEHGQ